MDGSIDVSGDINENNDVPVWIGKKATEDIFLHGIMDEFAILNVGLTEEQIRNYMENGLISASPVNVLNKLATCWSEIRSR